MPSDPGPFVEGGYQPDFVIRAACDAGMVRAEPALEDCQLQPASLDLRLGATAWRLRAGVLPGAGHAVADKAADLTLHRLDLKAGCVLETGCVYLVRLAEELNLPRSVRGRANPKSSIGRIDVFTRLVCDGATRFDHVPEGYRGPLYAEISPRTFPILVRAGDSLNQLRFVAGDAGGNTPGARTVELGLDLSDKKNGVCGYRARRHAGLIDLARTGGHDPALYWEEIRARDGRIVLDPGEFHILASREDVQVGAGEVAEMTAVAPELGEFRAHYAGFFDPGFGLGKPGGRAVLEVRSRDAPFILEHGQIVARLEYRRLAREPERLYGENRAGASYQGQGLSLARYFAGSPAA